MSPPGCGDKPEPLTDADIRVLRDVATAVRAGRSVVWVLLKMGAFTAAFFVFVYTVLSTINAWHTAVSHGLLK